MKKYLKLTLAFMILTFAHSVAAYEVEISDKVCKKPKFTLFSLPEYTTQEKLEAPAGSDFSFVVSNWIDPNAIKLWAKKKPLPFTVENKNSFFVVHSKLLPEHNGQIVRIDVLAIAKLGCKGLDGWLLKVADK